MSSSRSTCRRVIRCWRSTTVVATPHTAFYSEQSIAELARLAAENVAAVLAGRRPASVVNPEVYG